MPAGSTPTVAIAHDYLTQRGGAERVVLALTRAFPSAPVYTTLYDPRSTYPELNGLDIRTGWLNRIPWIKKFHRLALPLLAFVSDRTVVDADVVIASSSGWAHGFASRGPKIVYCYSPARWLYQPDAYLGKSGLSFKRLALLIFSPYLKYWDKSKALKAAKYFAISSAVQQRIRDTYGIDSEVLPAPHSIDISLPQTPVDTSSIPGAEHGFYLCISRLLPYKNVGAVMDAMNSLGLPLIIVGAGPEERRLASAAGPSVAMFKDITDTQIRWLYAKCIAVVSASYEDFGLTPIEAAAYGKPSIVLRWGGFLDTVIEGITGVYFDEPTPDSIRGAVSASRAVEWDAHVIKQRASDFSEDRFAARLLTEVELIAGRKSPPTDSVAVAGSD